LLCKGERLLPHCLSHYPTLRHRQSIIAVALDARSSRTFRARAGRLVPAGGARALVAVLRTFSSACTARPCSASAPFATCTRASTPARQGLARRDAARTAKTVGYLVRAPGRSNLLNLGDLSWNSSTAWPVR
jgi:hypothetical protein